MGKYLCILLPFPPTTNHLFAGKTRRFKSHGYKSWEVRAGHALNQQKVEHFSVPVRETISLGRPRKKDGTITATKRDLGNYEKAINDLLVTHHILLDDHLIHKLTLEWDDKVVGAMIEIEEL